MLLELPYFLLLCELIKLALCLSTLYFFSKLPATVHANSCLSWADLHLANVCWSWETKTSPNRSRFLTAEAPFFNLMRTLVLGVCSGLGKRSVFFLRRWHCFLYFAVSAVCYLYEPVRIRTDHAGPGQLFRRGKKRFIGGTSAVLAVRVKCYISAETLNTPLSICAVYFKFYALNFSLNVEMYILSSARLLS